MEKPLTRTLDDVRKHVGDLTEAQGLVVVWHLLERYNATRICEVPETLYGDFIDQCELLISQTNH